MLDAKVPYGGSLCIPGPARPTLWWAFMPGMAPRYPEGSVGVWASLKPRDGGLFPGQPEYPHPAGRQGSHLSCSMSQMWVPHVLGMGTLASRLMGDSVFWVWATLLGRGVAFPWKPLLA